MSKTEKINKKSPITSNEDQIKSRRKALKSMLAASGVVAGSQALSSEWTRPLVESVVLPTHAQTSVTASTFTSGVVEMTRLDSNQPWYAKTNLLDSLISPAHAIDSYDRGVGYSVCSTGGTAGMYGGSYLVMFKIDGSDVSVCVNSLGDNMNLGTQRCTQQATATLSGQNITDVTLTMDASIDEVWDQEDVQLSNLVVNGAFNQITGTLAVVATPPSGTSQKSCSGSLTCDLTSTVYDCSAAGTCQDDGSLLD